MKRVTFSYNATVVNSKEEGNKIEEFKPISFDLDRPEDQAALKTFFNQHVYSCNKFIGRGARGQKLTSDYEGYAINANYKGMYAIGIDYDDGHYTVEEAHKAFSNYIHIIHTSSSHMLDVPRHKGIQPRFRVILPLEVSDEVPYHFENSVDAELVYSLLKERYPEADSSVFSMGRKLFPFTGESSRYEFIIHIPDKPADGSESLYYTLTFDDLETQKNVLEVKSATKKRGKTDKINRNDVIILADRITKKRISDISVTGTKCFCLFCDDLDSEGASGQINFDKHGNYNLFCHHCNKTYWEQDLNWKAEAAPNIFFDAIIGHAGVFDEITGQVKYFKNDKDWISFCTVNDMPREIYAKIPRANRFVDLKRPSGFYVDEFGRQLFNIYAPGKYLEDYATVQARIDTKKQRPLNISGLPKNIPYIWWVLKNVFGDEADIKLFLNWLAYLIQYRKQSSIAWIIITRPGTGKGLLAERILRPIFGQHAVLIDEGEAIAAQFNSEDSGCWIKVFNEVFTKGDFTANLKRREWFKNRIGTKEIMLEAKGIDKIKIPNLVNYLLFSNIEHAFVLEEQDRRFNIINTIKNENCVKILGSKWWKDLGGTEAKCEAKIEQEIPLFAEFIQNVDVDHDKANEPTDTAARRRLIEFSLEDIDFIIGKLNTGEVEYFELDNIFPSSRALIGSDSNSDIRAEVEEFITKYHAIPSKYAIQIFGHHMRTPSRINIKRKLEQRGMLIGKQVWYKEGKANVRCYIHESQVGSNKLDQDDIIETKPEVKSEIKTEDKPKRDPSGLFD